MNYDIARIYGSKGNQIAPTPNMRFMSLNTLRDYCTKNDYEVITVTTDNITDYWLSPSMKYFDVQDSGDRSDLGISTYSQYALIKRDPSLAFPAFDGSDSSKLIDNCFLVFITNIEYNQLAKSTRYYYEVDWWDTLLMQNRSPAVQGICQRAHVDDIDADNKVITDYFTDEVELHVPTGSISSWTHQLARTPIVASKDRIDVRDYPLYYLYLIVDNGANIEGPDDESLTYGDYIDTEEGIAQVERNMPIQSASGAPARIFATLFCPRTNRLVSVKGYPTSVSLTVLTDPHILAMYLSVETPDDNEYLVVKGDIERTYYYRNKPDENSWILYTEGAAKSDGIVVYPASSKRRINYVDYANFLLAASQRPAPYNYILQHFSPEHEIAPSRLDNYNSYLLNGIVKAHMYPYTYFSVIRGSTKLDIVSRWVTEGDLRKMQILHDKATDTYTIYYNMRNAMGIEQFYTFDYPTLFNPPYKEDWLERTTSLEAASINIAGTAVGMIASAAMVVAATVAGGGIGTVGVIAGLSGLAQGGLNYAKQRLAYDREQEATDNDYFVRGSLTTQSVASLNASAAIYMKYTSFDQVFSEQLRLNLHRFGYYTMVDVSEIINQKTIMHRRKAFNFVKTVACAVISGGLPLDVRNDIKDMFDNGVWLFSDYSLNFEVPNPPDYSVR